MSKKRATLIVSRSDRKLWNDGPLKCRVIDLFGSSKPELLLTRAIPPTVELELDLPFDGAQAYGISVDAVGHRSAFHVLTRKSFLRPEGAGQREMDATIVRPMLVHKDAAPSDLTAAFKNLETQGSPFSIFGAQPFAALRLDAARLAFLNIEAKLRETRIGTRSLLSFVRDVRAVSVDRVFLFMAAELRSLVADSSEFADARGHSAPPGLPGLPAHPDSWKQTTFAFGNLQLSFSKTAAPQRGSGNTQEQCFSVDCDVDLERDLGHAFEFINNEVFRKTTDQALVYRMLWGQGVLPAYHLIPPGAAAPAALVRVGAKTEGAASSGHAKRPARATAPRPVARASGRRVRAARRRSGGSR